MPTANRSAPKTSRRRKRAWLADSSPHFYVPDDVLAFYRESAAKGAELEEQWQVTPTTRGRPRTPICAPNSSGRCVGDPAGSARGRHLIRRTETSRRASRRRGDERNCAYLPELVGGSADLDPSTKTYLKDWATSSRHQLRGAQPALRRPRACHGGDAPTASRLHAGLLPFAATFFNFLDYLKPALRLACSERGSARSTFSRTIRSFLVKTARRTSRSNNSRRCARRRTVTRFARPTRSKSSERGSSPCSTHAPYGDRADAAKGAVPGRPRRAVGNEAPTFSPRPRAEVRMLILIATGSEVSLAVDAGKSSTARASRTRVVSMPCWELFARSRRALSRLGPAAVQCGARVSTGSRRSV